MSKAPKKLVALALVGAGVFGTYQLLSGPESDEEAAGTENLVNHFWIQRMPEHERDMVAHLLVLDHPRMKIGVAGKSSQWRHFAELFKWGLEGDTLLTAFPQERARAKFKVKTWDCSGDAPHPFELCLKISRGDRSVVFYSREDWVVEPHDVKGSLADLEDEHPELAGVFEQVSEGDLERLTPMAQAVDPDAMAEVSGDWMLGE